MDVYVLNPSHFPIAIIDVYQSLIWTKRYYTYGDFELCIPANDGLLQYLKPDYFLQRDDDDSIMVIERLEIRTDTENGDFFIVSGRSLESILLRRVFKTTFSMQINGSLNGAVWALVQNCTSGGRDIPGLTVNMKDSIGTDVTAQFTGKTLLDAITAICQPQKVGIKMTFDGLRIYLSLYQGNEVDVIFSPDFDNMINSKYEFDYANFANFVYVAGEGEGLNRKVLGLSAGMPQTGINLREVYVDARDISSNDGDISTEEYDKMLRQRGMKKLSDEYMAVETFEAEIDPQASFQYKKDYNLGDVVTVTNEYGVTAKPRIIEIIESWDDTGYTVIPTFDALEVQSQ